jgi:hypothetical protein
MDFGQGKVAEGDPEGSVESLLHAFDLAVRLA